ncbi:DUF6508 domain-containing protein [Streptomyces sp. CA-179760]|uniref:DUF6508 domain-containing protein n=1 Tax=Streptomyces sp. CA-179760 TaxID=3240054 RepID=UPI003D8F3C74
MISGQPDNSRFEEDFQFKLVAGPARYSIRTDGPVAYLSVADRTGTVIGYLWANDEDDAAGWVVPPGLSPDAVNAGGRWVRALRDGKARRVAPTAFLAELARGANDCELSHVVPGSLTEAPSLAALREVTSGSEHQPVLSRFDDDMMFREKPGGPVDYMNWTDKPVRYFTVVDKEDGSVLGYLWAGDEDDAAGYEPRKAGGPRAANTGMPWITRLREGKARGLPPTQTLAELYDDPEPGGRSHPLPDSIADAPDAAAVEALATGDPRTEGRPAPEADPQDRVTTPVHYITVTAPDGEVIGYAWVTVGADDVDWVVRKAGGLSAIAAGTQWYDRIRAALERGLTPLGVLNLLSREPGVGPVTEAPDAAAVQELARIVTLADDRRLLAQLDRGNAQAWLELADAFDSLTGEDRDVRWDGGWKSPSGANHVAVPLYSEPLCRAVRALEDVGAVTPEHRWMGNPMPQVPSDGRLPPADAVRAATAIVRGERVCDGMIADALKTGLLDAVATSLRDWYADPHAVADLGHTPPARPQNTLTPHPETPHPQTPTLSMCRFCGGSPAADVTFRAHRGLLVLMGFRKTDGPMCMTCGLAVYRALTTHTLAWGWWSPFSLFVFAPLTLVRNALAVREVKRLPAPGPGTLGPRYDPGVPVRRRPRAYVALVPVLWVLFMIVAGLSGGM